MPWGAASRFRPRGAAAQGACRLVKHRACICVWYCGWLGKPCARWQVSAVHGPWVDPIELWTGSPASTLPVYCLVRKTLPCLAVYRYCTRLWALECIATIEEGWVPASGRAGRIESPSGAQSGAVLCCLYRYLWAVLQLFCGEAFVCGGRRHHLRPTYLMGLSAEHMRVRYP